MKKIEEQMIRAVRDHREMKSANTAVRMIDTGMAVYLHGNLIAKFPTDGEGYWSWTLAGWNTPTTRSRINALSRAFGGDGVSTRKGQAVIGGSATEWNKQAQPIRDDIWVCSPRDRTKAAA